MLENIGQLGYLNAVILFCALVFVHELGHYLVARWNKVTVEVFSIGFGPELVGWVDKAGTRWRISMIPLGGYVKMLGEETSGLEGEANKDQAKREDIPQISFSTRSIGARTAIIAAGPAANFLFAMVLYAILFATMGKAVPGSLNEQGISMVEPNSAAALGGMQAADRIIAINGKEVDGFEDLIIAVQTSAGNPIRFDIVRGEAESVQALTLNITPEHVGENADGIAIYRLGVGAPPSKFEEVPFTQAITAGVVETFNISLLTLNALWETITGQRGTDDLGGPIKIVKFSNDIAQLGIAAFISFAAILSINLGLINLFPIPVLDGGHLVFLAIEKLRGGRPLNEYWHEWAMRIGLAVVLGLMVFVTINDILGLLG